MLHKNKKLKGCEASSQILLSNAVLQEKEPGSLREIADSGAGQRIYRMSLELLVLPESKGVPQIKRMGACPKAT